MRVSPGPVQSSHGAQGAAAGGRGPGLHPGFHNLLHGVEAREMEDDKVIFIVSGADNTGMVSIVSSKASKVILQAYQLSYPKLQK